MQYNYNDIVRQWYEELKPLFINYLHRNFMIDYDGIMDIYNDVWVDVRSNIRRGNVEPHTNWRPYILKMGWYRASNITTRRPRFDSIDNETFNREKFEEEYSRKPTDDTSTYETPEMQQLLASELSYIPDPCSKILKLYYYDELSMSEIADTMNYSGPRSAITTKNRCMEKLRTRMITAIHRLGILQ